MNTVIIYLLSIHSWVKYFIKVAPPPDFLALARNQTSAYPSVQGKYSFNCMDSIPGYELRAGYDFFSANMVPGSTISDVELKAASAACDSNNACQSFNTDVTLKSGSSTSPAANGCLYVRQGLVKVQPNDTKTCLTYSTQEFCSQCSQLPVLADRASCYRCLSSSSFSPSQCIRALMDGRLLNYSRGLTETVYPNSTISSICYQLNVGTSSDLSSSDSFLYSSLLAVSSINDQ